MPSKGLTLAEAKKLGLDIDVSVIFSPSAEQVEKLRQAKKKDSQARPTEEAENSEPQKTN